MRLSLLFEDARRCLQLGFEAIQHHCLNTYHYALTWIPAKSLLRQQYLTYFRTVPQVQVGLLEEWGPMEYIMAHRSSVTSVVISRDGRYIVSRSDDNTVQIWNTTTGMSEHELKGHVYRITSIAIAHNGRLEIGRAHV